MYLFYLDTLQLPIAPEKLEIKIGNNNKTLTLINEGEINLLKTPSLTEIEFEAVLPMYQYPFAIYPDGFHPPEYYLNFLESLKTSCKVFRFKVLRYDSRGSYIGTETNIECSLEEYTIKEDAGNSGRDFAVSVRLKQYRHFATKVLTINAGTSQATSTTQRTTTNTTTTSSSKTYIIARGDTLWEIAKTKLGNGNRWKEIYTLNKDTIEKAAKANGKSSSQNGSLIWAGTQLKLP